MTTRTSRRDFRRSPRSLAKAGGAVRNLNSTPARRGALRSGQTLVPEDRVVCLACYRVVRVRPNGGMYAHSHCPAAIPTHGGHHLTDYHLRATTPPTPRRTTT